MSSPVTRRSDSIWVAFLLVVGTLCVQAAWTRPVNVALHGNDFGTFLRAACSGQLYGDDPLSPRRAGLPARNLSAPQMHLVFRPLCVLSPTKAYDVWMGASLLTLFAVAFWALNSRDVHPLAWLAVALSAPTSTLMVTGQVTAVMFVLSTMAWRLDRRAQPLASGVALGLLLSLKPIFVFPVLWWLLRREWRAIVGVMVGAGAGVALGLVAYGPGAFSEWIRNLDTVVWHGRPMNASLWGLWARAFGTSPDAVAFTSTPVVARGGTVATCALVSALTLRNLWAARTSDRATTDHGWLLCLAASLLVSPLGWIYYGWLLVPMILVVKMPRAALHTATVCVVVPWGLLVFFFPSSALLSITAGSMYSWGLLALWIGAVVGGQANGSEGA